MDNKIVAQGRRVTYCTILLCCLSREPGPLVLTLQVALAVGAAVAAAAAAAGAASYTTNNSTSEQLVTTAVSWMIAQRSYYSYTCSYTGSDVSRALFAAGASAI